MAMPWSLAKTKQAEYLSGVRDVKKLTALFDACFRIQREASEAAGRHIPMVVENVRGAQKWVGRSRWNFGSFHLWGDVPALMPMTSRIAKNTTGLHLDQYEKTGKGLSDWTMKATKNPGFRFDGSGKSFQSESVDKHIKNNGGSWLNIGSPGQKETNRNPVHELAGQKTVGLLQKRDGHTRHLTNQTEHRKNGGDWFGTGVDCSLQRKASSKSKARKAASAMIARIPEVLARYIASVYKPIELP